jgi:diaminopimelate decarboxylase
MDYFTYQPVPGYDERIARLLCEDVAIDDIAAAIGTPCYIYSARTMHEHAARFAAAFAPINPLLCYAVKACSNTEILRRLFGAGMGADVVSGLELERAWLAGCPMEKVVFAGVGKSDSEVRAALDGTHSPLRDDAISNGHPDPASRGSVGVLNSESRSELERIATIAAELKTPARVAIRLNPDIDAGAHDHTTTGRASDKFGVPIDEAEALYRDFHADPFVRVVGFHVHLGSPIYSSKPYTDAVRALASLIDRAESHGGRITHLDLGGGFGADYQTGQTPSYQSYAEAIIPAVMPLVERGVRIALEPGRTIMGNAGVLVVSVRHVKRQCGHRFVICDAGMNALIRPSLYGAKHSVWPTTVSKDDVPSARLPDKPSKHEACDIVGPVCETGDFLARGARLPEVIRGDRLAVFTAGAYGMTMANTYNDQPLPCEVLVDGERVHVIRERQQPWQTIDARHITRQLDLMTGAIG